MGLLLGQFFSFHSGTCVMFVVKKNTKTTTFRSLLSVKVYLAMMYFKTHYP